MTNREIYNQAFQDLCNHCWVEEQFESMGFTISDTVGAVSDTLNYNYTFCYNLIYHSLGIKILEVKEKNPYNITYLFAYPDGDEDYEFLVPLDRLDDLILSIKGSKDWQNLLWKVFVDRDRESLSFFEESWHIKFGVDKIEN